MDFILTEKFDLPSKGLAYPENSPFRKGFVILRQPTTLDKDILLDNKRLMKGTAVDDYLKNLLVQEEEKREYNSLLVGDRMGILIFSRILEGEQFLEAETQCKYCGTKNHLTINLGELKIKEIDFDKLNPSNEYESIICNQALKDRNEEQYQKSCIKFRWKLLTVKDEIELNSEIERAKKISENTGLPQPNNIFLRFKKHIISIEYQDKVIDSPMELNSFLKKLPNTYINQLLREINKISVGIDTKISYHCNSCGNENETQLPINLTDFFLPARPED